MAVLDPSRSRKQERIQDVVLNTINNSIVCLNHNHSTPSHTKNSPELVSNSFWAWNHIFGSPVLKDFIVLEPSCVKLCKAPSLCYQILPTLTRLQYWYPEFFVLRMWSYFSTYDIRDSPLWRWKIPYWDESSKWGKSSINAGTSPNMQCLMTPDGRISAIFCLVGGLEHFLFFHILGKIIPID